MKVVTVATDKQRYFPYLQQSCKRNQCELVVLGWGQKWQGFAWRLNLLLTYLDSVRPDEIICFVDAYDVIVLQHHDIIVNRFKEHIKDKSTVLFSEDRSSRNSFLMRAFNSMMFPKCKKANINAGTYIGYAKAIKLMLTVADSMKVDPSENDQIVLQKMCQSSNHMFSIDTSQDIFLVICSVASRINREKEEITITNKTLRFRDTTPCILHATGNADIDDIISELDYRADLYNANNDDNKKYMWNNTKHYAYWFVRYYLVYFILIVLVTCIVFIERYIVAYMLIFLIVCLAATMYYSGKVFRSSTMVCNDKAKFCNYQIIPNLTGYSWRDKLMHLYQNGLAKRVVIQQFKSGSTISCVTLIEHMPELIEYYTSRQLQKVISDIVGEPVYHTNLSYPTSCCVLIYDKINDMIDWHYDVNYFDGRFFTLIIPVTHTRTCTNFEIYDKSSNKSCVDLQGNSVLFEGAKLFHRASELCKDQLRIVLVMQFSTKPSSNMINRWKRFIKDRSYIGFG